MIIELVGLPGAGKSYLAEELAARGAVRVLAGSRVRMILSVLAFEARHPLLALRLAVTILLRAPRGLRYSLYVNGYVVTIYKWMEAKRFSRMGKMAVVDQGFLQLIVSLGGVPHSLIESFPKADAVAVVETPEQVRRTRMQERGWTPRPNSAWEARAEKALKEARSVIERVCPHVRTIDGTKDARTELDALIRGVRTTPPHTPFFKRFVLFFARILAVFVPRTGAAVLMYHAVDNSGWKHAVTPDLFEKQVRHMVKREHVVTLKDVVNYAAGREALPPRAVALTFDDGYRDLVTTVLPIITKYEVPITVFLNTDLSARTNSRLTPRVTEADLEVLKASSLVSVESHGRTHPHLPELNEDALNEEIVLSREDLRARGIESRYFAYPFGDRNPAVEAKVAASGYEAALAITEGFVESGDDPMHLKRIQVDATQNLFMFKARLTSALIINRRLVDLLRL